MSEGKDMKEVISRLSRLEQKINEMKGSRSNWILNFGLLIYGSAISFLTTLFYDMSGRNVSVGFLIYFGLLAFSILIYEIAKREQKREKKKGS
jgi:hypothetical protein